MDLEVALRSQDHRVTRPRQVVWDVLTDAHGHLSAQEIADEVSAREPGINVSSVYRTLTLFAELELVRESRRADGGSSWEPSHGDDVIHLVCSSCGVVRHHASPLVNELRHEVAHVPGFHVAGLDVAANGVCERCES
ncbi:MAG TPA: Fur family transcriptional regulator [Ilumatobacter sp.]|nr:Fur family transcriptional regulator [Ilumatobacter sp.]